MKRSGSSYQSKVKKRFTTKLIQNLIALEIKVAHVCLSKLFFVVDVGQQYKWNCNYENGKVFLKCLHSTKTELINSKKVTFTAWKQIAFWMVY